MRSFALAFSVAGILLPGALGPLIADPMPVATRPAPALAPGEWINGTPTTIAAQRGKVTVLLFWTHSCINCKHNLGFWNDWARRYRNSNVTVLSVHTPETVEEHTVAGVRRFVQERGLVFPVVIDNAEKTWDAYHIMYWPSEVLIDKHGRIRYLFGGELNYNGGGEYRTVQGLIEKLREEPA